MDTRESLVKWLQDHFVYANADTLPIYVGIFRNSWENTFHCPVPDDIENIIRSKYLQFDLYYTTN
jgi:hypothetical protein